MDRRLLCESGVVSEFGISTAPKGVEGLYEVLVEELDVDEFDIEGILGPRIENESNTEGPCELQNIDMRGGGSSMTRKIRRVSAQVCARGVGKRTNEGHRKVI